VQECKFFYAFYFRSMETVRRGRHVSYGSEQLQASARVKKLHVLFRVAQPEENSIPIQLLMYSWVV